MRLRDRRIALRETFRARTGETSFRGEPGERYGFTTRALDRAGNREPRTRRLHAVARAPAGG